MSKFYNSKNYSKPIEVANIFWEVIVIITDKYDREIIYTWYDIVEKNTQSNYINKCLLWWFIKKIPKTVLIIWFWWWAFAKYLEDHLENVNIDWIDIDETMFEIAKNELKVKTNNFYIMDALNAIDKIIEQGKTYDLVLIDVYGNDWEIPEYFSEKYFFEKIKQVLLKDWVLSINFADYNLENIEKTNKYNKIHSNLVNIFWEYYSHILAWVNDRWNVSWIYNLDKFYTSSDYDNNHVERAKKWEILYDEKIIENTILEWK